MGTEVVAPSADCESPTQTSEVDRSWKHETLVNRKLPKSGRSARSGNGGNGYCWRTPYRPWNTKTPQCPENNHRRTVNYPPPGAHQFSFTPFLGILDLPPLGDPMAPRRPVVGSNLLREQTAASIPAPRSTGRNASRLMAALSHSRRQTHPRFGAFRPLKPFTGRAWREAVYPAIHDST